MIPHANRYRTASVCQKETAKERRQVLKQSGNTDSFLTSLNVHIKHKTFKNRKGF